MNATERVGRIKRAELLSSLGAGVLGAGIALLLPSLLVKYAIPLLVLGLIAHAVGMTQAHALEQEDNRTPVWWVEGLYWFCWVVLALLALYALIDLIGWI